MYSTKTFFIAVLFCGTLTLACLSASAQDKITKQDGSVLTGEIIGVSGSQLQIRLAAGVIGYPLAQVSAVEMKVPAVIAEMSKAAPAEVLTKLLPVVNTFKGLPAEWVVEAMSTVADAYSQTGDEDKAQALYQEMGKLYPGSRFLIKSYVGLAKTALHKGQPDEALKLLEPVIQKSADQFYFSDAECRFYSEAYFFQAQALEAKGNFSEALASYLMTTTVFYQNDTINAQVGPRVAALKAANPKLTTP